LRNLSYDDESHHGTAYIERCREMGLGALTVRRRRQDIAQVIKILKGIDRKSTFKKASEDPTTRQSTG
jgi:hypothetical protein